jgi:aryl-alcohol dehydrogenase-like predicted oxidoreductase
MLTGKYLPGEQPPPDSRAGGDEITSRGMSFRMTERGFAVVEVVRRVAEQLGKTPAQVALKWVATRDGVTAPILGARTVAQLDDNLGVIGWDLDADLKAQLTTASDIRLGYPNEFHSWMAEIGY